MRWEVSEWVDGEDVLSYFGVNRGKCKGHPIAAFRQHTCETGASGGRDKVGFTEVKTHDGTAFTGEQIAAMRLMCLYGLIRDRELKLSDAQVSVSILNSAIKEATGAE